MTRVLILGGTSEASALARALEHDGRFAVTLSLAGVTRTPHLPALPTRIGGFGGAGGLQGWLEHAQTDALVDATHPFAQRISRNALAAATDAGVPLLRIDRPAWEPVAGDRWTVVPTLHEAAAAIGQPPARVLLTIGRQELVPFLAHPQHHYVVRSVDPPPPELLPPGATVLTARGPFTLVDERALLLRHRIGCLVTKNSGGDATAAKLVAAREAGLGVVMVARPAAVPGPSVPGLSVPGLSVPDWRDALRWLERRHQDFTTLRRV